LSEARHAAWADLVFRPYLRGLFRRSFHALRLIGDLPDLPPGSPVILIGNHNTWWDGFFPYFLNDAFFHRNFFIMMLEEQLALYPFFRKLGAFGIRQGHPRSVMETLRYSASLLKDPESLLCVYPQGVLAPFKARPLGFQRGLEKIISLSGVSVSLLQYAIRCEFSRERLPEAFFLFAPFQSLSEQTPVDMTRAECEEEKLMDRLETEIAGGARGRAFFGRQG
jgi:1-acyl-sn-glycerol-3-phosphate acyltransferase